MGQAKAVGSSQEGPTVSIIIPMYNCAGYIGETLESVFAQTFTEYEVIAVNDGSPDTKELERVLQPYRPRIHYIRQENRGVSGARNTGILAARSPLIALLDNDDLWEPDYLAVLVPLMQSDPTIAVIYPNALCFGDSLHAGREVMEVCPSEGEVTFESLMMQQCNVNARAIARREAIIRAGRFDESIQGPEDFDLWLRIVKQGGRIVYDRRVLARVRARRGSISSDPIWMAKQVLGVLDKAERTLNLTPAEAAALRRQRQRFQATLRLWQGKKAFFAGDTKTAIEGLSEANTFFRSGRIAFVLLLLRVVPRFLLKIYDIRDRFVFGMSTKL